MAKYFNRSDDESFYNSFIDLDKLLYSEDFWELIECLKVYARISKKAFIEVINHPNFKLENVLHYRKIADFFGEAIREFMLKNRYSAEYLLKEYAMNDDKSERLYFIIFSKLKK